MLAHPSAAPLDCPTCKSDYRRGDLFCRECGAQVAQPSGPPKAGARRVRGLGPAAGALLQLLRRARSPRTGSASSTPAAAALVPDRSRAEAQVPRAAGIDGAWPRSARPPARRAPAPLPERRPRAAAGARRTARAAGRRRPPPGAPELAEPASRLAAFVVDTVFVLSGQAVLLAPVGWYWWARETPRTPSDVSLPAGDRLRGHAAAAGAAAGRALPRLLLEREGRDAGQGAARAAGRDGRRRLPDPARERAAARARLPALGRQPGPRLPDGGLRRTRAARPDRVHAGREGQAGGEPRRAGARAGGRAPARSWRSRPPDAVAEAAAAGARAAASCAPAGSSSTTCRWRCCSASS